MENRPETSCFCGITFALSQVMGMLSWALTARSIVTAELNIGTECRDLDQNILYKG
jgi:hypothetical protein